MPRSLPLAQLLAALSASLGRDSARQELKWFRQALQRSSQNANNNEPENASPRALPPLASMLSRRVHGEPLQYILGAQPFGHLDLLVRAPVLIPRPETEDWALRLARALAPSPQKPVRVLDLCTGSGCIPLLLCASWAPGAAHAVGVDASGDALRLARDNARVARVRLTRAGARAPPDDGIVPCSTFTPLRADVRDTPALAAALAPWAPFDVVTANPPYIPRGEYVALDRSVRAFEDPAALLGDPPGAPDQRGLSFYYDIARLVARGGVLADEGWLVLEVGHDQARAVEQILHSVARLPNTEIWRDPWGVERTVVARAHRHIR
ncbi:S-adenosyl-L-methionine-dependent methyltransferase [Gloeopeniophorella convolvens]|nr:S-adenosyl-L-methionine-dependent methyltransferase [Gloeopeniophorella convolvens]